MKRIPIAGPSITDADVLAVAEAVKYEWYENANKSITEFEEQFAQKVARKYAIALPSCTAAIHLSLLALGINNQHQVIVPDITWIATSAPINYVCAEPVFVDVDLNSWCITAESIRRSYNKRVKCIIAVDLYGDMPDWDGILAFAKANNIYVIEDAAEAIGSYYNNKPAGSFGDISVFSFHGSKTLTTGEGGMLVTDNAELYEKALFLRDHGRDKAGEFYNLAVAYKYKMSILQAALGLSQLQRLDYLVNKKREIYFNYSKHLKNISGIQLNRVTDNVYNSFWMVTIILDRMWQACGKDIREQLKTYGIDSRPFFHPLSSLPAYAALRQETEFALLNPNSYAISPYGLNLPSALNLTEENIIFVTESLKKILNNLRQ